MRIDADVYEIYIGHITPESRQRLLQSQIPFKQGNPPILPPLTCHSRGSGNPPYAYSTRLWIPTPRFHGDKLRGNDNGCLAMPSCVIPLSLPCHSRRSGNPPYAYPTRLWIPTFVGMTTGCGRFWICTLVGMTTGVSHAELCHSPFPHMSFPQKRESTVCLLNTSLDSHVRGNDKRHICHSPPLAGVRGRGKHHPHPSPLPSKGEGIADSPPGFPRSWE